MKKIYIFFISLILSFYQLNKCEIITYNNEFNEESEIKTLEEIMDRVEYKLTKESYIFKNGNPDLIYILEKNSDNLIVYIDGSEGLKNLNIIEYGGNLTIKHVGSEEEKVYITSIPNSNVFIEVLYKQDYDNHYLKQKFTNIKIIETQDNNLIANFDSFDGNNELYLAKFDKDTMSPKDINPININKFEIIDRTKIYSLENHSTYIIINKVKDYYLSSFELFITRKDSEDKEITIDEKNAANYIYLSNSKKYLIRFRNPVSRLIKLSSKTLDSKIKDNEGNIILDKDNVYYELKDNEDLNISVEGNDSLIEFLYNLTDGITFDQSKISNQKIENNSTEIEIIIKLDFPSNYIIKLESDSKNAFGTSISGKFGKDKYHYNSKESHNVLTYGFSYEDIIKKEKFENRKIKKDEYFIVYLFVRKANPKQPLYLSYYPEDKETFDISILNTDNFTNIDLNTSHTYKYIIESDDVYTFDLSISNDKIKSYYPIYVKEDKSEYNELKLEISKEKNKANTFVYLNFYKNWPKDETVKLVIISEDAKDILLGVYIVSGIFMVGCLVGVLYAVCRIIKNRKDNIETSDGELLNN